MLTPAARPGIGRAAAFDEQPLGPWLPSSFGSTSPAGRAKGL
jgi:hypothetical protein